MTWSAEAGTSLDKPLAKDAFMTGSVIIGIALNCESPHPG